ncbi:aspartyl protease family protein [Winogradskyella sp.]|uniref:aspartyl protease family protein n=1 Tax=Winogradskyella sp. TaxID=1883156 RepID=UPI0026078AB9|nr:aspartyl protease family protein [Winogradskyella sp.]
MKLLFKSIFIFVLSLNQWLLVAQGEFFLKNDVSKKINFEFASNLIIIPVEINGVSLSFVLDTGVRKPILFNLTERDSLDLKNTKTFYLQGLGGDGKLKALKSSSNRFQIGDAVGLNKDLYVVFDKTINFTPRLGVLVHGIIGYDLFKDFVVEVNYSSKYIRLHKTKGFKPKTSKKWKSIPIDIHKSKPYVNAAVTINNNQKPVKLLIDTGSSDALWLFEDERKGLVPNNDLFFRDYLGKGLSGSVYGKRSRINAFELSSFVLEDVNVAYPDTLSVDLARIYKERNGSLGGDILKRFNLFFDYENNKLYLKKNARFKDSFTYNNSGIVLEYNGTRFVREKIKITDRGNYNSNSNVDTSRPIQIDFSVDYRIALKPIYKVVELRETSSAFISGLRVGDILISVNGNEVYDYKLPEINAVFHGKTGKNVRLEVEREGKKMIFRFKLDDVFKKNERSN